MSSDNAILSLLGKWAGENSAILRSFAEFIALSGEAGLDSLLEEIDESDYSLEDWIEALLAFDRWLEEKGESRRPFREIFGYIHCCTLAKRPGLATPKLNIIVNEALTEFGFEFLIEPQI